MNWYTTSDVAELFGVKAAAVRVWIRTGKLRAERYGRGHYLRVSEAEVKRFTVERYGG